MKRNFSKIFFIIFISFFFFGKKAQAQYTEYEVKGAIVFQFMKNTTWNSKVFNDKPTIKLGILGDDPFGEVIDNILKNRTIGGRRIEVLRKKDIRDLVGCHIIFMSKSQEFGIEETLSFILNKSRFNSVLTVGDNIQDFCKLGGIINFKEGEKKYSFNLNAKTASEQKLILDTKLMRLADEIINPQNRK